MIDKQVQKHMSRKPEIVPKLVRGYRWEIYGERLRGVVNVCRERYRCREPMGGNDKIIENILTPNKKAIGRMSVQVHIVVRA